MGFYLLSRKVTINILVAFSEDPPVDPKSQLFNLKYIWLDSGDSKKPSQQ